MRQDVITGQNRARKHWLITIRCLMEDSGAGYRGAPVFPGRPFTSWSLGKMAANDVENLHAALCHHLPNFQALLPAPAHVSLSSMVRRVPLWHKGAGFIIHGKLPSGGSTWRHKGKELLMGRVRERMERWADPPCVCVYDGKFSNSNESKLITRVIIP